jgi:Tfp pilus assembly protein PilN
MIRLNLLPDEAQGRRAGAQRWMSGRSSEGARSTTAPVVWLTVIPAFLIAGGAFGYIYFNDVHLPQQERRSVEAKLNALRAEVSQMESQYSYLREAAERFERQAKVIDILMPPNRILWSEKFNQISQCVPDNVYITHVQVNEQVREIETPESANAHSAWMATPQNRRGPEPERIMVPSIIQTLAIEGISYARQRERRIQLVLDFWSNLVNHASVGRHGEPRRFMEQFAGPPRIEYNESQDVAGVEVNAFRLVMQTVDLANMPAASPAPPAAAQTAQSTETNPTGDGAQRT